MRLALRGTLPGAGAQQAEQGATVHKRLALGVAFTPDLLPEQQGRLAQVRVCTNVSPTSNHHTPSLLPLRVHVHPFSFPKAIAYKVSLTRVDANRQPVAPTPELVQA